MASLIALTLANSQWAETYLAFWETPFGLQFGNFAVSHSLRHWINDGLMTLFFFVISLELKRELAIGELRDPRAAALSLAGALGGMAMPAALYLLVADSSAAARGWGTVMATDAAFVVGALALLGSRIPLSLRLFLLSLAIFDDIGAILVVAFGYGTQTHWPSLAIAAVGLLGILLMSRLGVRSIPVYFGMGFLIWVAVNSSGVHPTLAGVVLGLLTPAAGWISRTRLDAILQRTLDSQLASKKDLKQARIAARETFSPVERLETGLHPWVAFLILPIFALANAGVPIVPAEFNWPVGIAVLLGFVVGKPLGVFLFSYLAVRLGIATLPTTLTWPVLAAGGLLTGVGFTMAIFIAELAFDATLLNTAKLAILIASGLGGLGGLIALRLTTTRPA